jgi:transglutaminase-like putative cysteine protease
MPLHGLYYLLYALGIAGGLWLHGHPVLTTVLLLATPPLALVAYLPHRWLHAEVRQVLHYVVACSAVGWAMYRAGQQPPLDVLLIETFSLLGLSFAFSTQRRGYYYLLMIAIVLLFYGAVAPPRPAYVAIVPLATVLCLVLLYQTRAAALANTADFETQGLLPRGNWPWLAVHAVLVAVCWAGLVVLYPAPGRSGLGLAASSFRSNQINRLPPRFQAWFRSPHLAATHQGEERMDGPRPTVIDRQAQQRVQGQGTPTMGGGGSAAPPGQDLVMRVASPLKLYWLVALYDLYDGQVWHASPTLTQMETPWLELAARPTKQVRQQFQIEKWVTTGLPAAYLRTTLIQPRDSPLRIRTRFASAQVLDRGVPLPVPFQYEVQSALDLHLVTDSPAGEPAGWYEPRSHRDYLDLPQAAISARLRDLVAKLITDTPDPLARAYRLRDYLREQFPYSLTSPPVPTGRETVDYFVFELQQGHCEYFAASLTVMARLAGLPARVATGFSPGDYNVLSGMFEVKEYHAHAWTQVFIPELGWVTMDATPPGALPTQSRTTPFLVGKLRDPFSEEWRVKTPELSQDAQTYLQRQVAEQSERRQSPAATAPGTTGKAPRETPAEARSRPPPTPPNPVIAAVAEQPLVQAFLFNARALGMRIREVAQAVSQWLVDHLAHWEFAVLVAVAAALRLAWPTLRRWRRRQRRQSQCQRWLQEAERLHATAPAAAILAAYRAARVLLELAGCEKPHSQALEEYVQERLPPPWRPAAEQLFAIYTRLSYYPEPPTAEEAATAVAQAQALRALLAGSAMGRKAPLEG